jgi:hypothetical protein
MGYEEQCKGPSLEQAEDAKFQTEMLGFRIDAYLRKCGWKSSSNNPASLWLWEKQLPDGRVILVDRDTALIFQEVFEMHDDESEIGEE